MRITRLALIAVLVFGAGLIAYKGVSAETRHEIEDGLARLSAKNFDWPPDTLTAREQTDVIGELQRRGYGPKCYGSLLPEEKIGKDDDYECWFIVKSAYDDVPAKMVMLSFSKGRLENVKLEFPESSFSKLQSYLSRRLDRYPHASSVGTNKQVDIYGKPLIGWTVKEGSITTSAEATKGKPITLLWSASLVSQKLQGEATKDVPSDRINQSVPNNLGTTNVAPQSLRSCEEFKTIATQAAELANNGVAASSAKLTINEPKFDGIINQVYAGNGVQERQRIVRDVFMACQDMRNGKEVRNHWTRDEYKLSYFKSCKESRSSHYKNESELNVACNCFSNTLVDAMPDSEIEIAGASPVVFTDFIKSNIKLFEKCSLQ